MESKWQPIEKAEKGIGPLLLRVGAGPLDPVFVGYQDPNTGQWLDQERRSVRPNWFAKIPPFDCGAAE